MNKDQSTAYHSPPSSTGATVTPRTLVSMKIISKIVKKQLLSWRSCELLLDLRRDSSVIQQLNKSRNFFGHHAHGHIMATTVCAITHVMRGENNTPEMKYAQFMKCSRCATDSSVTAEEVSSLIRVKIDAWQNFGGRGYPTQLRHSALFSNQPGLEDSEGALERSIEHQFLEKESLVFNLPKGSILQNWVCYALGDRITGKLPDGRAEKLRLSWALQPGCNQGSHSETQSAVRRVFLVPETRLSFAPPRKAPAVEGMV